MDVSQHDLGRGVGGGDSGEGYGRKDEDERRMVDDGGGVRGRPRICWFSMAQTLASGCKSLPFSSFLPPSPSRLYATPGHL
ncbi:hypothetical protein CPAR01_03469 [Colletotrichum paranaense]|uniref:Uncharacterized protein n=1 Tax=Colletotrichum paranaense TaxID=1914294 RepID=A0ABQ9T2G6_9PEZI|nr:uncharacterized protein CPAR01_03469 [Colletotrichum paranaense]KAK1545967.1 hypothetical protein CPAR01_03469 [Colletotrichum paranaense]